MARRGGRPATARWRGSLHRILMALVLASGVTALVLTVAAVAIASNAILTDHAQPTASAQAAPTSPASG